MGLNAFDSSYARDLVLVFSVAVVLVEVFWRSGVLVFWRSGVLAFWCSGVLAFWCSALPCLCCARA